MAHTLLLRHRWALGDTVLVTALTRDIQLTYPGQYRIMVDTTWTQVWTNNPRIVPTDYACKPHVVELDYREGIRLAHNQGEHLHFLGWYHRDFSRKTGIKVECLFPKAELVLTDAEQQPWIDGRYWVIFAGGKLDMTTKLWSSSRYQEVVNRLREHGLRFVQVGATHHEHVHPPLKNVLSAVGRTENIRDLFGLIAHSEGVICGITSGMHIAAAFDKPCVVIAGGREETWWEMYSRTYPEAFGPKCAPVNTEHRFLHTIGQIHCCAQRGCWKKRTVPIDRRDLEPAVARRDLCSEPVKTDPANPIPLCLDKITVDQVVEAVLSYPQAAANTNELHFLRPPTVEGREQEVMAKTMPVEILQGPSNVPAAITHPVVGGRFTVCVLCWGPHPELAKRCLDSILRTMPPKTFDLRVACNDCAPDTIRYLRDQPITRLYIHSANKFKYPVMREMFWDKDTPITTQHVIWFDDDSFVVDPNWLTKLAEAIIDNHPHGVRMYGWEYLHDFARYPGGASWFKQAPWSRGRDYHLGNDARMVAPNGTTVRFATGGWWAIATEAMRAADIPDPRLGHNGGDITLGAQLHQAGFKTHTINRNKCLVHSSGAPRRGYSESFPWAQAIQ